MDCIFPYLVWKADLHLAGKTIPVSTGMMHHGFVFRLVTGIDGAKQAHELDCLKCFSHGADQSNFKVK